MKLTPSSPLPQLFSRSLATLPARFLLATVGGVILGWASSLGLGAIAAEQITLRFGPVQPSVTIAELEQFAQTGQLPPRLKPFKHLIPDQMREVLTQSLVVNPDLSHEVVKDLLRSQSGARLLNTVSMLTPDTSIQELETALAIAAQAEQGWSVLGTLKALPQSTITLDAPTILAIASHLNFTYGQNQSLGQVLERQLDQAVTGLPAPSASRLDPAAPGSALVRHRGILLRDTTRDRLIPVDLYWSYRADGPIVVISHGFGADRKFLAYLAEHLASHGLVVAAIEHPGSNVAALTALAQPNLSPENPPSRLLPGTEFIDRPQDVSLVLDHLAWLNRYSHNLRGRLNTDQVTMVGHSLGGSTALILAGATLDLPALREFCANQRSVALSPADWLQCAATDLNLAGQSLRDDRIQQIILLNPIIGQLFGETGLRSLPVPVLMMTSTDDPVTPTVQQQLWPFVQINSPKYLVTAIHATHLSIGDPHHLNPVLVENPLLRERPAAETESLRTLIKGLSLAFVQQQTLAAERYEPFLSPSYAQTLSTAELPLHLSTTLPSGVSQWVQIAARPNGNPNPALHQLRLALHLEAIGAWNQVELAWYTVAQSLGSNSIWATPMIFGIFISPRVKLNEPAE